MKAPMSIRAETVLVSLLALVVVQRLVELWLARRNARWARGRGAREFGAEHYPMLVVMHTGWLVAWAVEAWVRGPALASYAPACLLAFVAAQLLRYAAITALGWRWNTRILVIPGAPPVRRGPYRVLRHPNYVAVAVEFAALPLMFGAVDTALIFSALNLALLLGVRIPAEMRALAWATEQPGARG